MRDHGLMSTNDTGKEERMAMDLLLARYARQLLLNYRINDLHFLSNEILEKKIVEILRREGNHLPLTEQSKVEHQQSQPETNPQRESDNGETKKKQPTILRRIINSNDFSSALFAIHHQFSIPFPHHYSPSSEISFLSSLRSGLGELGICIAGSSSKLFGLMHLPNACV